MPTFECVYECVCVCPLSRRGVAAYGRPPLLQPLLSAFSPATVSSRHAITLSNETGMLAREPAASALSPSPSHLSFPPSLPPSVHRPLFHSFCLSPLHSLLHPDWPVQYSGSRLDECGWKGRDWKTVAVSRGNWDKDGFCSASFPLPVFSFSEFLFLNKTLLFFPFWSSTFFSFFCTCCPHFILRWSSFTSPATVASAFAKKQHSILTNRIN